MLKRNHLLLSLFCLGAIVITFLLRNNIFFWDTIQLASKHAHWYYGNNFSKLLLPAGIDSGHPPGFGMYLALVWKIFGKSLMASHFAMIPFLLGILFFLFRIGEYFGNHLNAFVLVLLTFACPTLASQSILVSPDVALVFFFLMGLYGVLGGKVFLKILAALGLAMVSMRGMMVVVLLFVFEIAIAKVTLNFHLRWKSMASGLKKITGLALPYVPAGLFALAFLFYHYQQTGWVGYHADSPWSPGFERASGRELLRNFFILGWRLLDFGRIFVWIAVFYLFFIWYKKRKKGLLNDGKKKVRLLQATWLLLLSIPILGMTFLLYKGLHAHRYLLPVYLSLSIFCFTLLVNLQLPRKFVRIAFALVFAGLLSGNFWIYPEKLAQGWDASLAHLPYYALRSEMISFIEDEKIPLEEIGTAFPEIGPLELKDLSGRTEGFIEKDLNKNHYILYSNVMNDYSDEEIDQLASWEVIKALNNKGISLILYEKIKFKRTQSPER